MDCGELDGVRLILADDDPDWDEPAPCSSCGGDVVPCDEYRIVVPPPEGDGEDCDARPFNDVDRIGWDVLCKTCGPRQPRYGDYPSRECRGCGGLVELTPRYGIRRRKATVGDRRRKDTPDGRWDPVNIHNAELRAAGLPELPRLGAAHDGRPPGLVPLQPQNLDMSCPQ